MHNAALTENSLRLANDLTRAGGLSLGKLRLELLLPSLAGLAKITTTDVTALDERGRVDMLIDLGRQRALLDSYELELLAATKAHDATGPLWCVDEVAAALRVSGNTAQNRLDTAERLVSKLPNVMHELRRGGVSADQAKAITDPAKDLPDEALGEYQGRVLKRAGQQTVQRTRSEASAASKSLNPVKAEERSEQARESRCVFIKPTDDDMAWLSAYLPAADRPHHAAQSQQDQRRPAQTESARPVGRQCRMHLGPWRGAALP